MPATDHLLLRRQASDRFNDEESNVQDPTSPPTPPAPPNTPATPPATLPPNPPSDGTDGHTGDQTTHHKGKGSSTDPPRGGTSASDNKGGEDDTSSDHSNGLGAGSIALISIAVVAVVVGGVLGAIFFVRRRRMSAGLAEVMGLAQSGSTGVPSQLDAEVGFLHKKSACECICLSCVYLYQNCFWPLRGLLVVSKGFILVISLYIVVLRFISRSAYVSSLAQIIIPTDDCTQMSGWRWLSEI